jgi:diacylglycerol kinase (ATP)
LKTVLVFNPNASAGRSAQLLTPLLQRLEQFSEVVLHSTEKSGDATEWVAQADLSSCDALLAAGGDGTLFEVLNGLYARPPESRPPLGVIPVGTGNAFARDLGLMPGDWQKGVDLVANGKTRLFDVGRAESPEGSFHFLNILGVGLPVDVMQSSLRFKVFGRASYSVVSLLKAMQMNCYPLKITADGREVEQDVLFAEVSNTRFTGTSFMIAPRAEPDDGLLDVTLVGRLSRLRVLKLFPSVYEGRHIEFDEVETFQAREIRIESDSELKLAPDGELLGATPAVIRCLHRDLPVFSP